MSNHKHVTITSEEKGGKRMESKDYKRQASFSKSTCPKQKQCKKNIYRPKYVQNVTKRHEEGGTER
jgi:hypothetical protein